jgi:ribosomal protein S18 acetylase RimI-like enzyme
LRCLLYYKFVMNPLQDILDSAALAVEKNFDEWQKLRGQMEDVRLHDLDATCLVSHTIGGPNDVTLLRFAPAEAVARVDEILKLYDAHDFAVSFWLGPACTPGMKNMLRMKGLRCTSNLTGMALTLEDEIRTASPTGIELNRLLDFSIFKDEPHPVLGRARSGAAKRNLAEMAFLQEKFSEQVYHLGAFSGKCVVGTATLFLGPESAGIYDVAVLPELRRRGIGTAMTAELCHHAQSKGYEGIVLIASKDGRYLYWEFGFQEVSEIKVYVLSKSQKRREARLRALT